MNAICRKIAGTRVVMRAGLLLVAATFAACKSGGTPAPAPVPSATVGGAAAATRPPEPSAGGLTAAGITPQLIARGDSIFHVSSCTDCHGRTAKGTAHGPDLTSGMFVQIEGRYDEIVKIITTGVPEAKITDPSFPEPMPARGGTPPLTDEQIRALAAYIYRLSHP